MLDGLRIVRSTSGFLFLSALACSTADGLDTGTGAGTSDQPPDEKSPRVDGDACDPELLSWKTECDFTGAISYENPLAPGGYLEIDPFVGTTVACCEGAPSIETADSACVDACIVELCRIAENIYQHMFKSGVFRQYVQDLNTGSLIQHMFTSQVNDFVLPLPPEAEHEALVGRLEALLNLRESISGSAATMASGLPALAQSILAKAFRGELVPQDPTDEPASVLLERIRTARETTPDRKRPAKRPRKPTP